MLLPSMRNSHTRSHRVIVIFLLHKRRDILSYETHQVTLLMSDSFDLQESIVLGHCSMFHELDGMATIVRSSPTQLEIRLVKQLDGFIALPLSISEILLPMSIRVTQARGYFLRQKQNLSESIEVFERRLQALLIGISNPINERI